MAEPTIGLSVRHPNTDDAESLARLMLDAYEGTIDADGSETLDDARTEVAGYFSAERQPMPEHSFVALDGDVPVAAVLVARYENLPLIAYVMTAAAHKGAGLATALTHLALASLHAAGERRVHLWVTSGNTAAERIYERIGFRDVPPEGDAPLASKPSAGHVIGGVLAGLEQMVTGRPKSVPQIEEPYGEEWASAEGVTVEGLEQPVDRPEPPDRSGARL
jgi:RimJ/RimL family protein N-acetyltransferase